MDDFFLAFRFSTFRLFDFLLAGFGTSTSMAATCQQWCFSETCWKASKPTVIFFSSAILGLIPRLCRYSSVISVLPC
jgi:hypothetical protein